MCEFQRLGMEVETVGRCAVERIAEDRASETFGMGAVDAELMCASGVGAEGYERVGDEFVVGDRLFAVCEIHSLTGAIQWIDGKWQCDGTFERVRPACCFLFEFRDVAFTDGVVGKLLLEIAVGLPAFGGYEESAGGHVQTVGQENAGVSVVENGGHGMGGDAPRHAQQSRGLADDNKVFVLIEDAEGIVDRWQEGDRIRVRGEPLQHPFQHGQAFAAAGRVVLSVTSDFCLWRLPPPEFGHGQRVEPFGIGVLKKFRSTTVTGASGRKRKPLPYLF